MESQRNWKYISTRTKYALMNMWNILVRHVIPTMNCLLHQYLKNYERKVTSTLWYVKLQIGFERCASNTWFCNTNAD